MEEQTVSPQPIRLTHDRRRGRPDVPGNLAMSGARERAHEDPREELGALQPVGGREGLRTEGPPAVNAKKPLDAGGCGRSNEEAFASPAPTPRIEMEFAARVRAARRSEGCRPLWHEPSSSTARARDNLRNTT